MSVDRAQIEHLRSFVATPRCMSYETIRSLGDILDNFEAASAEVAALRRQLEERGDDGVIREPEEFALASELQAVRGELATARDALRGIWPFIEEDDGGFATPAYQKAINDVRAALAMTEDANP